MKTKKLRGGGNSKGIDVKNLVNFEFIYNKIDFL